MSSQIPSGLECVCRQNLRIRWLTVTPKLVVKELAVLKWPQGWVNLDRALPVRSAARHRAPNGSRDSLMLVSPDLTCWGRWSRRMTVGTLVACLSGLKSDPRLNRLYYFRCAPVAKTLEKRSQAPHRHLMCR